MGRNRANPMLISEVLRESFCKHAIEALSAFSMTTGQCVALCAYNSVRLTESAIQNKVALGSLCCNGLKTFEYKPLKSTMPLAFTLWDGHAWIELQNGIIGEPSLFRTARAAPRHSNLRRSLEAHMLLEKGALLISADAALDKYGLAYKQEAYLNETAFMPLIGGLLALNSLLP